MRWTDAVLTALIAAGVSLVASLATYVAAMRAMLNQRTMQERDLERRFTEKLYDLRLAAYPKAFAITDQLRGEFVFGASLSTELLRTVRTELLEWNRTDAGFLMSQDALKSFYAMRDALAVNPPPNGQFSRGQRKGIWTCKNRLRGFLKADLNLLYLEEQSPDE